MTTPTTTRGRRTRAALLQAGRDVFEDVGFADARIDAVCQRAGVSHGTFYVYFDSKEALFREVAVAVVGDVFVATRVGPDVPADPYARIEAANRLYLRAWQRNSRILRVLAHVAENSPTFKQLLLDLREDFVGRVQDGLVRLQQAGITPADLPPRVTAIALGGMVEHFAHVWVDLGEAVDEDEAVRVLTALWARSVGVPVPESERSVVTSGAHLA